MLSVFILGFLPDQSSLMSRNVGKLKPYALRFAASSNSWSRQSNAYERSSSKAPKTLPLSRDLFHVSNITRKNYWLIDCWFEKKLSKKVDIWAKMYFWKILPLLFCWKLWKMKDFLILFSCPNPISGKTLCQVVDLKCSRAIRLRDSLNTKISGRNKLVS